ncbi:fructosamine kinase family protein [Olsenella uli]|nr:fructosamine kinase family protein [Olsenella uli]
MRGNSHHTKKSFALGTGKISHERRFCIVGGDMEETFVKTAGFGDNLPGEAAALRWLAEAEPAGGIRVVRVLRVSPDELVEERVATGVPSAAAARRIGAGLARLHAAGAPWYGCVPDGWNGDPWCGRARTPYVAREDASATWGAFFAEHRVMNYVRTLVDQGDFGPSELRLFERVSARLASGQFDAPQPALVREAGAPCARLHGDLWAGNVLWDADPSAPTGGVLIDPMAYGGHAETDLAMLALFGYPFLDDVLRGYDETSPLADGWQERVGLHQLAPLLLHCVLFGGWYLAEAVSTARRYA